MFLSFNFYYGLNVKLSCLLHYAGSWEELEFCDLYHRYSLGAASLMLGLDESTILSESLRPSLSWIRIENLLSAKHHFCGFSSVCDGGLIAHARSGIMMAVYMCSEGIALITCLLDDVFTSCNNRQLILMRYWAKRHWSSACCACGLSHWYIRWIFLLLDYLLYDDLFAVLLDD